MLPVMPPQGNKQERELIKLFKALDSVNQHSLLSYADFLQQRSAGITENSSEEKEVATEPLDIPRPENESVIKGIKRLTANYPMVDKESILHPIAGLMTSHMVSGKKAEDVIDELEVLFSAEYQKTKNNKKETK
ncbi:MAG: hypothetical protein V3U71_00215 [Cocleimonas sp.]